MFRLNFTGRLTWHWGPLSGGPGCDFRGERDY
jgi:hypothetical protein